MRTKSGLRLMFVGMIAAAVAIPSLGSLGSADPVDTRGNWLNPAAPGELVYPDGELVSRPAVGTSATAVDQARAVELGRNSHFPAALRHGEPEVALRQVSTVHRGTLPEGSKYRTDYQNRVMWVLTYRGSQPDIHGPAGLTSEQRRKAVSHNGCVFVLMIDGSSGELVEAHQFC